MMYNNCLLAEKKMEKIGKSSLVLANELEPNRVFDTAIGYKNHYKTVVNCLTAVESAANSRTYTFQV